MAEHTIKVPTRRQRNCQYWLRGIAGSVAILGVGIGAGVLPLMTDGIPHQIGNWMQLTITRSARSVMVHSMIADGYVVLPPVQMTEDS
jgi:hypothetical protein